MKEARIIFPVEGALNQAVQRCLSNITHTFGGCTIIEGMGHWLHPNGQYLQENVRIADIAYEPSEENDAKLYDLAWDFREAGNQVEVYLRYGNGHVQMVTERSCMDNGEWNWKQFQDEAKRWEDVEAETKSDIDVAEHVEVPQVELAP